MRSRDREVVGGQVDVEGDQRETHPHDGRARALVEHGRAGVRRPFRRGQLGRQTLVLPPAHVGQRLPLRPGGRVLVVVDGHALLADPLAQPLGQRHRLLGGDAAERHERDHVHRPHPGMGAFVRAHVDDREGLPAQGLGRRQHRLGLSHIGEDGPVVVGVGAPVEQLHSGRALDRPDDPLERGRVAALADVGDALDELSRLTPSPGESRLTTRLPSLNTRHTGFMP